MPAVNSILTPELVHKQISQGIALGPRDQTRIKVYPELSVNLIDSKEAFRDVAAYGNLGLPQVRGSLQDPPQATIEQVRLNRYTNLKVTMEVIVDQETQEDEQPGLDFIRNIGRDALDSFQDRMEIDCANKFLNFADSTSTQYVGSDGVAIGSASHPLQSGTYSNILTVAETPSPTSVNKLKIILARQPAYKANVLMPAGMEGFKAFGPPDLDMALAQIQGSTNDAFTNQNQKNVIGPQMKARIIVPYCTFTQRWGIMAAGRTRPKWFLQLRRSPFVWDVMKSKNYSFSTTLVARYVFGDMDWRGAAFSMGSV